VVPSFAGVVESLLTSTASDLGATGWDAETVERAGAVCGGGTVGLAASIELAPAVALEASDELATSSGGDAASMRGVVAGRTADRPSAPNSSSGVEGTRAGADGAAERRNHRNPPAATRTMNRTIQTVGDTPTRER